MIEEEVLIAGKNFNTYIFYNLFFMIIIFFFKEAVQDQEEERMVETIVNANVMEIVIEIVIEVNVIIEGKWQSIGDEGNYLKYFQIINQLFLFRSRSRS